jgi:carbon-monoxide dehydrogenase medium subunit
MAHHSWSAVVIAATFDYARATSVDDALARLHAANGDAKFNAGGHSLVPAMKLRLSVPTLLIDIARIPELSGIQKSGDTIEIRAGTVHHDVASSALLKQECPMIAEAAAAIGDPQVRNRGTLGGSLAHADPAADYPAVMLALDADIRLRSVTGSRIVKARDFFTGLFRVDLRADEMIVGVQFRPLKSAAYTKLYQRASHFAIIGVAAGLETSHGTVSAARIAVTGAAPAAVRRTKAEEALTGKTLSKATVEAAAQLAATGLEDVSSDIHASAEYRRAMIVVFTERSLTRAMTRAAE